MKVTYLDKRAEQACADAFVAIRQSIKATGDFWASQQAKLSKLRLEQLKLEASTRAREAEAHLTLARLIAST